MSTGEKAPSEPQKKPVKSRRKAIVAIVLGGALVIALIIAATTNGFGSPEIPDGDVGIVEGVDPEGISQEAYDGAIEQAAAGQGLNKVPEEGTPDWDAVNQTAMNDLLLSKWVSGEAQERGVTASDREVDQQLEQIKAQSFGGDDAQFQDFLERSKLTEEEAIDRVRLQILSQRIQEQVTTAEPDISDEDVEAYYNDNPDLFNTPERRDTRVIVTDNEADAQTVADGLSDAHGPGDWAKLAKKYSLDQDNAATGAMRLGVGEGESDPQLDEAIFSSEKGEVVGPIETGEGWVVLEVDTIDPGTDVELDDETRTSIESTLAQQVQQEEGTRFQTEFVERWRIRTLCIAAVAIESCANDTAPTDQCFGDDPSDEVPAPAEGEDEVALECPAPVASRPVVNPGTAGLGLAAPRLPQGPQRSADALLDQALPIGNLGGAAGAPGAPGAAGGAPAP